MPSKRPEIAALEAELETVEAEIDAAYWRFCRCSRAKPPVLEVPHAYTRRNELKAQIAALRFRR